MQKITQNELIQKLENTETLTAVEIIRSHENPNICSVIINDRLFSMPYIMDFNFELLTTIKNTVTEDILVILFTDDELPKAWADAYTAAGIPKERHDRRVIPRKYNEMNEQFCIDQTLLWDITDEFKGTDHELTREKCCWRWTIIQWYKAHLI
ncbi:hypothetical protein [Methanobrevibacter sp.]|uniref:hypothetical protein n=1 Tax=Methanobrevibacter sp. TaxID=66852 RepID=UPI00386DCB8D